MTSSFVKYKITERKNKHKNYVMVVANTHSFLHTAEENEILCVGESKILHLFRNSWPWPAGDRFRIFVSKMREQKINIQNHMFWFQNHTPLSMSYRIHSNYYYFSSFTGASVIGIQPVIHRNYLFRGRFVVRGADWR